MKNLNHRKILNIGKYNKISLKGINRKKAIKLYSFMLKLRLCEEAIEKEYHPADEMRCPVHFCVGQEAVPAALNSILLKIDYLFLRVIHKATRIHAFVTQLPNYLLQSKNKICLF